MGLRWFHATVTGRKCGPFSGMPDIAAKDTLKPRSRESFSPGSFSREQLFFRHKLSHQQIDDLLHEEECRAYPEAKAQALNKLHEFLSLAGMFSDSGISFIPLKGPLLSFRLYNDPLYRRFGDIDLLMDVPSVEKAIVLLKERGYKTISFEFPVQERRKELLLLHKNEITLFHPGKGISIDLHWSLFRGLLAPSAAMRELITGNLTFVEYEGRSFMVLNPEFELLSLIYHGSWHCWNRLKWLADVHQLLKIHAPDETKFHQLTVGTNSFRLVGLCNTLLAEYFPEGPRVPGPGKAPVRMVNFAMQCIAENDELNLITFGHRLREFRFQLGFIPDIRFKINLLRVQLFPFDQIDNRMIPPFAFFFYLAGPFIKLWKRTKGKHIHFRNRFSWLF